MTDTLTTLCREYELWCKFHGLKRLSADELICEDVTPEQREYLNDFIKRWDQAVSDEGDRFI